MFRRAGRPFGSPRFRPSASAADDGDDGMDIDLPPPNPHGRLADFAIGEDGPSRKRESGLCLTRPESASAVAS